MEMVKTQSGLDESEARHAIETVEEAIGPDSRIRAQGLHFRLARRLGIEPARAVEVAQIACHAIATHLDADRRAQLLARLSTDMRELFSAPPSVAARPARMPGLSGTGHTLADGRPGSNHPLTERRRP